MGACAEAIIPLFPTEPLQLTLGTVLRVCRAFVAWLVTVYAAWKIQDYVPWSAGLDFVRWVSTLVTYVGLSSAVTQLLR